MAEQGIVAREGLIAHGRGEAFDYLLGEQTQPFARRAAEAAAAALLLARRPVLSVNGNVAALAAKEMVALAKAIPATIEVNLFHRTEERVSKIAGLLRDAGASQIVGEQTDATIPGLDHARAKSSVRGAYGADAVLVPLEDGDRAHALGAMGKMVIAIDLNPLSRTARSAGITIVDELTRALPLLTEQVLAMKSAPPERRLYVLQSYDNRRTIAESLDFLAKRLQELARKDGA